MRRAQASRLSPGTPAVRWYGPCVRLPHHPELLSKLRRATSEDPLRVLVSGCMAGWPCGVSGTPHDTTATATRVLSHPRVRVIPFCPEAHALGVPRTTPDIHGGDGIDVLRGRARVLDEDGNDLTRAMLSGAEAMREVARDHDVELALLMDMSAACGSQVISDGCRFDEARRYRIGVGVAAAILLEDGVLVVSQRDHATLERLIHHLDPSHVVDEAALDHHQIPWYRAYFARS